MAKLRSGLCSVSKKTRRELDSWLGYNDFDNKVGWYVSIVGWLSYLYEAAVGSPALDRRDETGCCQNDVVRR